MLGVCMNKGLVIWEGEEKDEVWKPIKVDGVTKQDLHCSK